MLLRRLLGALVLAVLVLAPAPAYAHASLVSSSPDDGAVLDALPGSLELTFSEEMAEPAYVVVTAPDGSSVTSGDPVVRGTTVTQALAGGPAGTYTFAYRVVSGDGHPVSGELSFSVGAPSEPGATPTPETADDDAPPVQAAAAGDGFWTRHGTHVIVGAVLFLLAGLLLWLSRRRAA